MPQFPSTSYNYKHIATATTTVVKNLGGVLHGISINSAANAATISVYDGLTASGTVIGIITLGAAVTVPGAAVLTDINFGVGLTLVTTGTLDITVRYA